MIMTEFYKVRNDGVSLFRTYSDQDFKIRQVDTGNIYDEAIDVYDSEHVYEETNEKVVRIEEGRDENVDFEHYPISDFND